MSPLYQGSLAPCPPSLRDWGSPPVPESRGDPRAHSVPSGSCSVPPKERWGPSPHALSHLEMGCVGSPCLSPMGLGIPQELGVHGVTPPYTPMELDPHDPMWGAPVGGVPITPPCSFRELWSPVTPAWGWFPSPHKATHGGPAPPCPHTPPWGEVTHRGSSCFWGGPPPRPHATPSPAPAKFKG